MTADVFPVDWAPSNDIIKVLGVGGGGCNAVNYMYKQGVEGCSFIVCNTDLQALRGCDVPEKIQLGHDGLGAGTDPIQGRNAALESQDEIARKVLDTGTQMLFITAGMGGGTGTGAAPIIAKMAKDRGILTVGVVTIPFDNQGNETITRAIDGIHEMEKNVDSLLIIKNQNIITHYGDLLLHEAFPKSDEVLATAVKGIIEIIKKPGYINVDFRDVKVMMKDSGYALMGSGSGTGPTRIEDAVREAFNSPLLNEYDLTSARNILINVTAPRSEQGILGSQYQMISDEIRKYTGNTNSFKQGLIYEDDPSFGDKVTITAIVTGLQFVDIIGPAEDLGNYIFLDKDFVYIREDAQLGSNALNAPLPVRSKIGFNSKENCRTFAFSPDQKPCLAVNPWEDKSFLENEPAIRRAAKKD